MTMPARDLKYGRLLQAIQPKPIRTKKEHAYFLGEIETLMRKGEDNLASAERDMLELLVKLVHDYERAAFPMKKSTPAEMLEFLMEENNLKAADLPLPASRVSEILRGNRAISKTQARVLAERFNVSPALFIF
jgi:HTH-type transcriptional regulator / antitoxin HigA